MIVKKEREREKHFKYKNSARLKVKIWRKIYCVNTNQKKDAIIEFISDKVSSRAGKLSGIKRGSI